MKQKQKPLSFSLHPDNIAYIEAAVLKQKEANHRYSRSMYLDDHITELRLADEAKKTKPKSKVELAPVDIEYPLGLNITAWNKWIEFRKVAKFKKYKTNAQMNKLAKMGDANEQKLIIQQSIDNEYQGLFALKGNGNGQGFRNNASASQKESSHERIKRENDVKYRGSNECGLGMGETNGDLGRTVDQGQRVETVIGLDNEPFIGY